MASRGDDNLVGVLNNTGHVVSSLIVSNPSVDIFGFDGDGPCGASGTGAPVTPSTPGYL